MSDYPLDVYTPKYTNELLFLIIATSNATKLDNNDNLPKCIIPIGGKPLIQWQLEVLDALKTKEVDIIIDKNSSIIVKGLIDKIQKNIIINWVEVDSDERSEMGSIRNGVALMKYRDLFNEKLQKCLEVIILSADLIIDVNTLRNFINEHRKKTSYLTLLMTEELRKPLKKGEKFDGSKSFGMTYANTSDRLRIPFDLLNRYPTLRIRDELQSLRAYIVRSSVLLKLPYNDKLQSIHKDLIPRIINLLRGRFGQEVYETTLNDLFSHIPHSFEPPCHYVLQKGGMTFRIVQQQQIKKVEGMVKTGKLKLLDFAE
ncbi:Nucleotidyl transferase domain-containing protein [Entamoeba marina]